MSQLLLRPRISYWEDAGKIRIVNRGLLTHQIALVWTSFMAQKSCLHWETYINLSAGLSVCPKHQDIVQFTFECCSKQDTRHLQHQPVKVACSMWRLGAGNACWMLDFWCLSTLMEASSFGMVKTKECNCNSPDIYWIKPVPRSLSIKSMTFPWLFEVSQLPTIIFWCPFLCPGPMVFGHWKWAFLAFTSSSIIRFLGFLQTNSVSMRFFPNNNPKRGRSLGIKYHISTRFTKTPSSEV